MPVSNISKVVYTARTDTVGGRENGVARSSDGVLDIRFSAPGSAGIGTNPEQLLAAGLSASFASAIALSASNRKVALPTQVSIYAEVRLGIEPDGYALNALLRATLPGIDRVLGQVLIDEARLICPLSKAIHSNLEVTVELR